MESCGESWYILNQGGSSDNIFVEDFRMCLREERGQDLLSQKCLIPLEGASGIWDVRLGASAY